MSAADAHHAVRRLLCATRATGPANAFAQDRMCARWFGPRKNAGVARPANLWVLRRIKSGDPNFVTEDVQLRVNGSPRDVNGQPTFGNETGQPGRDGHAFLA